MPVPPSSVIRAAVSPTVPGSMPGSTVRPVTYTIDPLAPSSRAMPLPIPLLAPVTIATRCSAMILPFRSIVDVTNGHRCRWPTTPQSAEPPLTLIEVPVTLSA